MNNKKPTNKKRQTALNQGYRPALSIFQPAALVLIGLGMLSWWGPEIFSRLVEEAKMGWKGYFTHSLNQDTAPGLAQDLMGKLWMIMGGTVCLLLGLGTALMGTARGWRKGRRPRSRGFNFSSSGLVVSVTVLLVLSSLLIWRVVMVVSQLQQLSTADGWVLMGKETMETWILHLSLLILVVMATDYFWSRHRFEKSLYMSHQELKDELRQDRGDPMVRGKRQEIWHHLDQTNK